MYESKTTFVIGAGASYELGFPLGKALKEIIAKAVDIKFEIGNNVKSGDRSIAHALRSFADYNTKEGAEEYNRYLRAGWHCGKAMPQAISIDNFVENQDDKYVTAIAKLGIASSIMDAEKNCLNNYRVSSERDDIDWNKFENNWIHHFCQTLTEGTNKNNLDKIFENVKFISFNYDRSLEFFLPSALSNYYDIKLADAYSIVSKAEFIHPYGQIGKLPWQYLNMQTHIFGSGQKDHLFETSKSILTFSEQIDDTKQLVKIRDTVKIADQIVFLGFAFHNANMRLLRPDRNTKSTKRALATAFGISKPDCEIVQQQIRELCLAPRMLNSGMGKIILDDKATCSSIFQVYGKTLTS